MDSKKKWIKIIGQNFDCFQGETVPKIDHFSIKIDQNLYKWVQTVQLRYLSSVFL